jgi:hypothetical protein
MCSLRVTSATAFIIEVLVQRNAMYREAERRSMAEFQHEIEAKRETVRQELEQLCGVSGGRRDAGAAVGSRR